MSKLIDLTGKTFGRITVLKRGEEASSGQSVKWLCKCLCGKEWYVVGPSLRNGKTTSWGCWKDEKTSKRFAKHLDSKSKLYDIWTALKRRCYSPSCKDYKNYGARGVTVQNDWKNSYTCFREWAYSNGYQEGLTIERIDVNGNYEENNCCWIKNELQILNRTNAVYFEFEGKKTQLAILCKNYNIPYKLVYNRIFNLGWNIEDSLQAKPYKGRNLH